MEAYHLRPMQNGYALRTGIHWSRVSGSPYADRQSQSRNAKGRT
jgi:hypothetical protein